MSSQVWQDDFSFGALFIYINTCMNEWGIEWPESFALSKETSASIFGMWVQWHLGFSLSVLFGIFNLKSLLWIFITLFIAELLTKHWSWQITWKVSVVDLSSCFLFLFLKEFKCFLFSLELFYTRTYAHKFNFINTHKHTLFYFHEISKNLYIEFKIIWYLWAFVCNIFLFFCSQSSLKLFSK